MTEIHKSGLMSEDGAVRAAGQHNGISKPQSMHGVVGCASRAKFGNVRSHPDLVTSKLATLHFYQLAVPGAETTGRFA
jgi:hypothetical protein